MSKRDIEKLLRAALLENGPMAQALYEFEFADQIEYLKQSRVRDNEDYLMAITENRGHVAMILIDRSDTIYSNELAREKLKQLWPMPNYRKNLERFIPDFAQELANGELSITGVRIKR
jgi:hypothetical protein